MNSLALAFLSAVLLGIGATLMFDLWGLFLKYTFNIPQSNICLVGRWLQYMRDGVFKHENIVFAPQKSVECIVGWLAHYLIGITFASIFIAVVGIPWLQKPTLLPAIVFGAITVLAPFLIMQPAFGFGMAASKAVNPMQARLRSLMNHTAFGIGLYFFGWLIHWLLWVYASKNVLSLG